MCVVIMKKPIKKKLNTNYLNLEKELGVCNVTMKWHNKEEENVLSE